MSSRQMLLKLPGVKHLHESGAIKGILGRKIGNHRGHFQTPQQAQDSLPRSRRATYDNDEIASIGIDTFSTIHNFDWPVLFHLQKLMQQNRLHSVTDFGGHVGVKFYAFRNTLAFDATLQWQVVDVPAVCREGRRRVPPEVTSLKFFERIEDTAPCDALICSGVLQYAETPIVDLIARMPTRPHMILLNKVAVAKRGEGYVTLENFGSASLPYRVMTRNELDESRMKLGYKLLSTWDMPDRDFAVLSPKGIKWVNLIGQAWVLGS